MRERKIYSLFSGKYDSTKQRAVLLNGDRKRNYLSYTLTMRMELLLTGQILFTEAQFFDGLYFHWLVHNPSEFSAFNRLTTPFLKSRNGNDDLFSFAIKCRPSDSDKAGDTHPMMDQVTTQMFCKQFQFSSIADDNLVNAVYTLSENYSVNPFESVRGKDYSPKEICTGESTLEEYIQKMKSWLKKCYGSKSSIVWEWEKFAMELQQLSSVRLNQNGFATETGQWNVPELKGSFLNQIAPDSSGDTYYKKMCELLDRVETILDRPDAKQYCSRIRDELSQDKKWSRSKITVSLEKLEKLNRQNETVFQDRENMEQAEKKHIVEKSIREFRQLMNDRYNKALAFRVGSQLLDMCDYTQLDIRNIKEDNLTIPASLIQKLATLSWGDFASWLTENREKLTNPFNTWMSAYQEFPRTNLKRIKAALQTYLHALTVAIKNSSPQQYPTRLLKPWDPEDIGDDSVRSIFAALHETPYYLVGGGSFEANAHGNEICILCVDQSTDMNPEMFILRLQLNKDTSTDSALDTLLAPVCNPLNGGVLPPVV